MSSQTAAAFNAKLMGSPVLLDQIQTVSSPMELITFARVQGFELTTEDLQAIAQQAYQQWLNQLPLPLRSFFEQAHTHPELNSALKTCQSAADVIALIHTWGLQVTPADLEQAARAATAVAGFSFERLWFRRLGMIP